MDGSATIAINRGMGEEQQGLRSIWRNGKDAKDCPSVPLKVKMFFNRELDRIRGKKLERERSKMRADEAARSSYVDLEDEEDDPDMQEALHQSR